MSPVDIAGGADDAVPAQPTVPGGLSDAEFNDGLRVLDGAGYAHAADPTAHSPRAVAFFDIDNTLVRGSSIVGFGAELAKQRFFPITSLLPFLWQELKFRLSGTENPADLESGSARALALISGREVRDLENRCARYVAHRMRHRTIPGTRALAQAHVDNGEPVWLVSATPVQLAQALARGLGFDGALGTVAEVADGRFNGTLAGGLLHGERKRNVIAALAVRQGFDLQACTAYSDSANDIPMLEMVGNAVAINPDGALRQHAKTKGWPVRDFRRLNHTRRRAVVIAGGAVLLGTLGVLSSRTGK